MSKKQSSNTAQVVKSEPNVAIVGATGLVGRELLKVLEGRHFPLKNIKLLASERSAGERIEWRDGYHTVMVADAQAFANIDIVLMSAGGAPSKILAPLAAKAGAIVIDNSSAWRMDDDVPLVVPEVNPEVLTQAPKKGIIANPNCSTIQMVVALKPLHDLFTLNRVVVSTYQAASGAGKKAMDALGQQVSSLFNQREVEAKDVFPRRLAFNCVPQVDVFTDDGYTKEEHKMRQETRKILSVDAEVCATCVRVPVFNGHSESVVAYFDNAVDLEAAKNTLRAAPGVMFIAEPEDFPTVLDAEGSDATYVGRLRGVPGDQNALTFWCVADNLRKGAASNAVQIAELLIHHSHATPKQ